MFSLGRITRAKGVFELLDAFLKAARENPKLTCVLVGSSPVFDESATVRSRVLSDPEIASRVKLLPFCGPDQVWEAMCGADMFAFTSHNEGMPNSLLEAMAMGIPAVAFGIPAVREIEAGTGALRIVPSFEVMAFSRAILELASSPAEQRRMGALGRARVEDGFMVRKNVPLAVNHLEALRPALKAGGPARPSTLVGDARSRELETR